MKGAVPKVNITVRTAIPRVPADAQIYTKLYCDDKLKMKVNDEMVGRDDKQRIAVLNEVARKELAGAGEEIKEAVMAEKARLKQVREEAMKAETGMIENKGSKEYSNEERAA